MKVALSSSKRIDFFKGKLKKYKSINNEISKELKSNLCQINLSVDFSLAKAGSLNVTALDKDSAILIQKRRKRYIFLSKNKLMLANKVQHMIKYFKIVGLYKKFNKILFSIQDDLCIGLSNGNSLDTKQLASNDIALIERSRVIGSQSSSFFPEAFSPK